MQVGDRGEAELQRIRRKRPGVGAVGHMALRGEEGCDILGREGRETVLVAPGAHRIA